MNTKISPRNVSSNQDLKNLNLVTETTNASSLAKTRLATKKPKIVIEKTSDKGSLTRAHSSPQLVD